jgi:acyl dehydratase
MDQRQKIFFEDAAIGIEIPTAAYGPMDRNGYIAAAIILRDGNPLHLDRVYARDRGLPDVVQQGPLNQSYLYRFITDWLHRPWDFRRTRIRFVANAFPEDILSCRGVVIRTRRENNEALVDCSIWQERQNGEKTLVGEATFVLPERMKA